MRSINEVTSADKLAFIRENLDNLQNERTLLTQTFEKLYNNYFRHISGFYVEGGKATIYMYSAFELDYTKTPEENFTRLVEVFQEKHGLTLDEVNEFLTVLGPFQKMPILRSKDEKEAQFDVSDIATFKLLKFFLFIADQYYDDHATTELMKAVAITPTMEAYKVNINGVKLQRFVNGKLKVSGLTEQQYDLIVTYAKRAESLDRHRDLK